MPPRGGLTSCRHALLIVSFLLQIVRQFVHARRRGVVGRVFRHALRLIYLPVKSPNFVRCVLKNDNETRAVPKFHIVTIDKSLRPLNCLGIVRANYRFKTGEMAVFSNQVCAVFQHGDAPLCQAGALPNSQSPNEASRRAVMAMM
jgi:hypothetical protein